jgi:aspartyl-tRNA(Asn)/glutamyl-tRNA(Gln) amidotransferase subunit A
MLDEGLAVTDEDYQEARSHQKHLSAEIDRAWGNIDVLLTPATPSPAPADLDTTGDPRFNSPWSYVGLPAVTFPIGLSASGVPIGVQWLGHRGEDQRLLSAACWGEQIAAFDHRV